MARPKVPALWTGRPGPLESLALRSKGRRYVRKAVLLLLRRGLEAAPPNSFGRLFVAQRDEWLPRFPETEAHDRMTFTLGGDLPVNRLGYGNHS